MLRSNPTYSRRQSVLGIPLSRITDSDFSELPDSQNVDHTPSMTGAGDHSFLALVLGMVIFLFLSLVYLLFWDSRWLRTEAFKYCGFCALEI